MTTNLAFAHYLIQFDQITKNLEGKKALSIFSQIYSITSTVGT